MGVKNLIPTPFPFLRENLDHQKDSPMFISVKSVLKLQRNFHFAVQLIEDPEMALEQDSNLQGGS